MKKVLTFLTLAAALVAVSCAKEQESPYVGGSMVTYTIDGPAQVATKAMGTIGSEYTLYYEVRLWDGSALGDALTGEGLSGHKDIAADAWPASVTFDLARGKQYKILFWAQSKTAPEGLYNASNLAAVAINYSKMAASNEKCDAFYGSDVITPTGATSAAATLSRPFALVNLGTNDAVQFKTASGGCTVGDVKVTINGSLANSFNVATGEPGAGVATNFAPNAAPIDAYDAKTLVVGETSFNYLSAVYVLPAGASDVIEVAYDIKDNATTPADITSLTVSNVPVKANHRTNITGKLLTGATTYNIDVDQAFADNTNKVVGPTFANVTALNAYFATMKDNSDNGDINPEEVTLETIADGDIITLPAIADDVVIRITGTLATGTLNIAYAASGDKPANLSLFVAQLEKLVADITSTHFTLLSGSHITNQADVHTNTTTFVIQKGAKVGTVKILQGNANIAGTVGTVSVPGGATADGTNPVQVFLAKEAAVDKITLEAKTDVVVEQPKDQIDKEGTEYKVAVYVNEGAANSSATAQNGGVIYVEAVVPCTVTADGVSTADEGNVSSTVIIKGGASGSDVIATNGGAINLAANDDCSVVSQGSSADSTPVPSNVTVTAATNTVTATTTNGGTVTESSELVTVTDVENGVALIGAAVYTTLTEAFAAANPSDVVKILKDYDATSESMGGGTRQFVINKSITVDGQGYTVQTKERGFGVGNVNGSLASNIDVTFKDITILNSSSGARCIDTRGKIGVFTLENVVLSTQGATSAYTQPLTIGGNQSDIASIKINNSTIKTNEDATAYYAIITFNPVDMTITNSTIKGWACIYAKGPDGSAGSAGSTFTVSSNSNLVSYNCYSGVSNAFSAVMIEDNNVTVNITDSNITIHNSGDQRQSIFGFKDESPLTGSYLSLIGNTIIFDNTGTGSCEIISNQGSNTLVQSDNTLYEGVLLSYDSNKTAAQNGTALYNKITALPDGGKVLVAPGYYEWEDSQARSNNWPNKNKSITIEGLGNPEDITIATKASGKYGIILQASVEGVVVTIKNITFTGAAGNTNFLHPIYVKDYMTLNLENVICKSTTGNKYGLLLDSSNTHVKGVTTTVNAKGVQLDEGKWVGLMAKPRSDAYPEYIDENLYVTYCKVNILDGCNFTAENCEPQNGALSTGYNLLVNDVPFARDSSLPSQQ